MAGEWPRRGAELEFRRAGDLGWAWRETEGTWWRVAAGDVGLGAGVAQ